MIIADGPCTSPTAPRGIVCPACGCSSMPVVFVRRKPSRMVRVRKCRDCNRRIRTSEKVVSNNAQ